MRVKLPVKSLQVEVLLPPSQCPLTRLARICWFCSALCTYGLDVAAFSYVHASEESMLWKDSYCCAWHGCAPVMWLPRALRSLTVRLLCNLLTIIFVFAFVFVEKVRLLCNATPYVRKASSVCCFGVSGVCTMSLYIEYGVVQRVRFECVCFVCVWCVPVCA